MRISKLKLKDFGRHRDLELTFAPGFTVIRGPNEAGKTTIQRAIELALFRKATATGSELDTLRSWRVSDDGHIATRIEFTVEEGARSGKPSISRGVLEKEFRGQKGRVHLELDGHTITDPARADQTMAELTGIPNEGFFRSTASIRHEELEDLDRDEGALRDRLQSSVGGGDRGSSRARARLDETIRALKARGDKNPGRLKIAEEAVARAETALRAGEGALERLERDRDALAQVRAARHRAEQGLSESRNLLEGARQADRVRSEKAVLEERYERLRQATDAQQRLEALEQMPERPLFAMRDTHDKMRALQGRVEVLHEALEDDQEPGFEEDETVPAYKIVGLAACFFFAVAVVSILGGLSAQMMPLVLIGATLVLLCGLLGYFFASLRGQARLIAQANQARGHERAVRRQGRVGTEEGLRVAQAGLENILKELGVPDVETAERLLSGEQGRQQEMATLQVQVSALLSGQSSADGSDVVALRDKVALELEQKTAALTALGPVAHDARARERLEAEVRTRQDALERARDAEAGEMARVEANSVDAEQVAGEAERLATWRDQLNALRRRLRIYEATLAAISAAEGTTMAKATRSLEQHVGRDIERLTGGRYRQVRIDDRTLDIEVWAPEREDWVSASQLSKGTIDQLYLAARIGLVRLVTQGRKPPLILDDPFVTFDDQRAARAALLLQELASDFQVIYLACSNRYDALADAVIELAAPTEVDASPVVTAAAPAARPAGRSSSRGGSASGRPRLGLGDSGQAGGSDGSNGSNGSAAS